MDLHDQVAEMAAKAGVRPPLASDITVAEYFAPWLAFRELSLRPTTWKQYQGLAKLYVLPHVGHIRLLDLAVRDLEDLFAFLVREGGRHGQPLARKTVQGTRAIIYTALQDAVRNGYLYVNPAVRARMPQFRAQEPRPRPIWSADQLKGFLDGIADHPHSRLIKLTALTGMRRGEVLGLAWNNVDFDDGLLEVSQQLAEEPDGSRVVRAPKSYARSISIGPQALDALRAERKVQAENRLRAAVWHDEDRDLVFTADDGQPIQPNRISRIFNQLVERSGLPKIQFQHLRHTHASLLLLAGVPIPVVTQRLGHSDQWTTLGRYAHVLDSADQDAANLYEDLLQAARRAIHGGAPGTPPQTWLDATTMATARKAADR